MAEHDAAHGEHLGQIAQAQLVTQPPEHHEGDDIGRVLGPVQDAATALIELLAARNCLPHVTACRTYGSGTGGSPGRCAPVAPSRPATHIPYTASTSAPP